MRSQIAAARPDRLPGHLADRHRSIERVRETLIEYSNVIRRLLVAELSVAMSDQSSGGFSPFSFFTRLICLGYGQVDLRDAERMYSDLTGLDVTLNPRQTQRLQLL